MNSTVPYGSNDQGEELDYYTEYLENTTHSGNTNTPNNNENSNKWTQLIYERSVTEKLTDAVQQKMNQPLQRNPYQSKRTRDGGEIDSAARDTMGNGANSWNSYDNLTAMNNTIQYYNNNNKNNNNMQATCSNGNATTNTNNTMPPNDQPATHGPMKRKRTA